MVGDVIAEFTIVPPTEKKIGAGGMQRSTSDNKIDFSLAFDGPLFKRLAEHLTKGAAIYGKRNWLKCVAGSLDEMNATYERYRESAFRHFIQWYDGDRNEDHMAAVAFNLNGAELLRPLVVED
jgi:hypothetical protein